MKICVIEGCMSKYYSLGWCEKHYGRYRRHGNPETKLPVFNRSYQTPETRAKISAAMKGKKKSLEMRMKLSAAKKGPGSLHFWKGGVTPINKIIRASRELAKFSLSDINLMIADYKQRLKHG